MRILLLALISMWLPLPTLAKEARIALVIGNSAYTVGELKNPVNDAQLIEDTLSTVGFDVVLFKNANQQVMKRAIQEFGQRLDKAGTSAIGLFFYAGHGLQLDGRNYLIPTTAQIQREGDVEIEAVAADWVLAQMQYARNGLNIVILDACRNNPFVRGFRSTANGLAKMDAPAGSLIAYSTAPGDVAADGRGTNSPYTDALVRSILSTPQPIEQVFKQTRIAVRAVTDNRQTPWESSSLTGDFYFRPPTDHSKQASPEHPSTPVDDKAVEIAFWQGVQGSQNVASYENYLARFPNGIYSEQARQKIAALTKPTRPKEGKDRCAELAGSWRVTVNGIDVGGEVIADQDGSLAWWKDPHDKLPAVTGRWVCDSPSLPRFIFSWGHGGVDTVTLSKDRRTLTGSNQFGMKILNTRMDQGQRRR